MRTALLKDNGAPAHGVPLVPDRPAAPVPEPVGLRTPATRETATRRPSALPRSPSRVVPAAEPAAAVPVEADEVLIADARAGLSPAEMVEQKLRTLLRARGLSIQTASTTVPVRGRFVRG